MWVETESLLTRIASMNTTGWQGSRGRFCHAVSLQDRLMLLRDQVVRFVADIMGEG